jgi:hypothetical protein
LFARDLQSVRFFIDNPLIRPAVFLTEIRVNRSGGAGQ